MQDEVKTLADYVIARHYPVAQTAENPYRALLTSVIKAQAELVAHWMHVGFIHGVMNTDNTSVSGETIDYGPCAFMDTFVFHQCFSSIDLEGRYAFSRQPHIALWNLSRFAECLLALLDENQQNAIAQAEASLEQFHSLYQTAWLKGWRKNSRWMIKTMTPMRALCWIIYSVCACMGWILPSPIATQPQQLMLNYPTRI